MEKVTPKLRFPEFEGKWDKSNLQDLSKKSISYGIVQTGNTIENGVPCLRVIDLTKDEIIVDDLITTSEKISNSYKKTILEEDELMIALRGVIGHTRIVTKNLVGFNLTRGIARVSPKKKIISPQFLLKYLNSPKCLKVFDQRKNGSALKEIPIGELRKILVEFPSLYEQQKIASFLTSVDERLTLLAQQKEKLELYKKGVMQQIFAQKLRFKDEKGNNYPDWEEKKLSNLVDVIKGKQLNKEELTEVGTYPCQNGGIEPSGYTEEFNTIENTITISEGGNSCGYVNFMTSKFWCGGHCYSLLNIKNNVMKQFLFQY